MSATYERDWVEQPEYRVDDDYIYKTYYSYLNMSGAARPVRNYSVCYDRKRLISHWVAYPIHDIYLTPNLTRKDCFGYDPNDQLPAIPMSEQQNITSGYGTGRHDRGHMLPNASRMNNYDINAMTFYATNMMPQNSRLNQNTWASLEGKVREARHSDTVYVVVGTYFGDNSYITDRSGNRIAEPSHVYKLMLRAKNKIPAGKTMADLSADEIIAIGFWFANTTAGNDATWSQAAVSVADVEERTGFKFFRNLDPDVAEQVKSRYSLSDWGTLFNN
ncbi:MAG: DNA/RNA non-specific endonuclease [Alistipes sp.]|nr:DNA/RNA non-specific endonuclease [Alistipes sp.]